MMRQYIERHRGREKVTFLHPGMEEILAETHGVMIYQEDVMRVAHLIAGMTLAEADLLRRAMSGKMRSQHTMAGLKEKFAEAARARGIAAETAAEIWRQMASFAEYAFCKAHSASFALLSFQVAYLKAHWPAEFMAAVLSNAGGFYHTQAYLDEARRLGLKILPPDINRSEIAYSASPGLIRVGLMQVGELRRETMERLIASRRRDGFFTSLTEFYERVKPDRREAENLIACGAFDAYEFSRPELLCKLHLLRRSSPIRRFADSPPLPFPPAHTIIPRIPDYDEEMKRALEHKTLGVYASCHPLALFAKDIGPSGFANAPTRQLADSRARRSFSEGGPVRRLEYIRADELAQHAGGRVELLGWLVCMKRVRTAKGEYMRFITMEDMTDLFEVVLFPRCYQRYGHLLNTPGPFVVSGRAENDSGAIVIKASRLRLLDTRRGRSDVHAQRAEGEKPLGLRCSALAFCFHSYSAERLQNG
jgi:DNA polymerase III alpha subunit